MKSLIPRLRRRLTRAALRGWKTEDDLPAFADRAAFLRKRGTRVGARCRLLGTVDSINPKLCIIGDNCVIGLNSAVLAHGPTGPQMTPTVLEDYVYLSFGAIVLPGVCMRRMAIAGAGAVVTKDVPPETIVVGNPARPLRMLREDEKRYIIKVHADGGFFGRDFPQS